MLATIQNCSFLLANGCSSFSIVPYHGIPPRPPRPLPPKPRLSFQQTVTRHPRNCPPKLGLAPWPTGGSGSTWNHKTGNHRGGVGKDNPQHREPQGPFPFPSSSTHTTIMMAMMLCTMTLTCYSQCGCWWYLFSYVALGFGSACSLLYLVENRAWLVMFLRKLYRPFVTPSRVSVGFAFTYA